MVAEAWTGNSWPKYGVLTAVDGSPEADAAVAWAVREAALRREPVTFVHVVEPVVVGWPLGDVPTEFSQWQEDGAREAVEQARQVAAATDASVELRTEVLHSSVVPTLIDASQQARMIVVGSRGKQALGRLLLGSVSAGLLHHARCPVAVVHADDPPTPDPSAPVLLGVDGSPASEAATAWAFEAASRRNAPLLALHAWSDVGVLPISGMDWNTYQGEGEQLLGERLAGWQEHYPDVAVTRRVVGAAPARWLIKESESAQLVVLGDRGRGGFKAMLLGSVSSAVCQSAQVPVVVVRAER